MTEINRKITKNLRNFNNKHGASFLFLFTWVALSILVSTAHANNLLIDNFAVVETDETSNRITFKGDVSWSNSWRTTTNNDAIWMFLKYTTDGGATWSHASMSSSGTDPLGFSAPSGFEIIVPFDKQGFFLQRTDFNSGDVSATGVKFVWDYAQDGLSDAQAMASNTINRIFGIEMVFVPDGSFYAGDGLSASEYRFKQGSADDDPWYIQSENALTTSNSIADAYYYTSTGASGESATGSTFVIPTSFPKGYQRFYFMKYELTEGQWVSFFNTLTPLQKTTRDITNSVEGGKASDAVVNRNTISWNASQADSEASSSRSDRPVSYISWPDLLAYADWAALRPVTEFEFEKVTRGEDITATANEFSWGTVTSNDALANEIYPDADEDGTEQIFDGSANLNQNSLSWSSGDGRVGGAAESQIGPLRAGIFAESSTSRTTSGAGYYGAMELSGNLYEMVVTVGNNEGRQYLATHGDGELSSVSGYEGNATNIDWPGINSTDPARGVTGTVGSGFRGGDFQSPNIRHFQISNRTYAATDPDSTAVGQRYDATLGIYQGGRLGRSAP